MRVITAPARMERREKAENAFARLAEVPTERLAAFLDARLGEKLSVNAEQAPRLAAANLAHAKRLHELAAADDGVRAKARALRQANDLHEADLRAILTPEQFARYQEMKAQLREALEAGASDRP